MVAFWEVHCQAVLGSLELPGIRKCLQHRPGRWLHIQSGPCRSVRPPSGVAWLMLRKGCLRLSRLWQVSAKSSCPVAQGTTCPLRLYLSLETRFPVCRPGTWPPARTSSGTLERGREARHACCWGRSSGWAGPEDWDVTPTHHFSPSTTARPSATWSLLVSALQWALCPASHCQHRARPAPRASREGARAALAAPLVPLALVDTWVSSGAWCKFLLGVSMRLAVLGPRQEWPPGPHGSCVPQSCSSMVSLKSRPQVSSMHPPV